jgi:hypothetical protein
MDHHLGGVCIVCSVVKSYYSYVDKSTRWKFCVPARTLIAVHLFLRRHVSAGQGYPVC